MSIIPILSWVLAATLRASMLVLVILLLQKLLKSRLSARWNYAIWTPVVFAILIPAQPFLPYWEWPHTTNRLTTSQANSASNPAVTTSQEVDLGSDLLSATNSGDASSVEAALATAADISGATQANFGMQSPAGEDAEIAFSGVAEGDRSEAASPSWNWQMILAAGWLLGAVGLFVVVWGSYVSTLRRIRRWVISVEQEDLARIQSLAKELGLRTMPEVWLSPKVNAPAVCGVLRPILLLSDSFFQTLSREEADFVLKHELMHIRRGDVLLNNVLFILLSVHWFNPLLWYAFARAKLDREAACDQDVLRAESPARRVAYGKALLRMEAELPESGLCLGFVGMVQRGKRLRERIQFISDPKRMGFPMKSIVLLCICVSSIFGIAKSAEPQSKPKPQQSALATDEQRADEKGERQQQESLKLKQVVSLNPQANRAIADSEEDAANSAARFQKYSAILREAHEALDNRKPEIAQSKLVSTDPELRGWEYEYLLSKSTGNKVLWTRPNVSGAVEGRVSCMTFTASGKRLILGRHSTEDASGSVSVWDFVNDKIVPCEDLAGLHINAVARSRDGKTIAAAGHQGNVVVWDAETGKVVKEYTGHNPDPNTPLSSRKFLTVRSLDYSPDGKQIVSSAGPNAGVKCTNALQIWSVETGKTLMTIEGEHQAGQNRPILSVALSPDGKTIASGGFEGTVTLWDVRTGTELRRITGPFFNILDLEFSPDGKRLACGSANSAVWDVASGKQLTRLIGYPQPVSSLAFSPDGKRLITGGWDRTVRIWDSQSGVQLLLVGTLKNRVGSLAISSDGKSIAAGGPEGRAIPKPTVWSYRTEATAQNSDDDNAAAKQRMDTAAHEWAQKKLKASRASFPPTWRGNAFLTRPVVSLTLYNASVSDDELKHLAAFTELKSLALNGRGITDSGLKNLITLKKLEALYLRGTRITDGGMKQLAKLRNLKKLDLSSAKLTAAGMLELSALPKLQELTLEHTTIDDEALQNVARMKELRKLNLRNAKISDDGLKHLAMMPELREIILQGTQITGEGLRHFATCKSLQNISCWGTSVTSEDIRRLKTVLPHCEIDKTLIE